MGNMSYCRFENTFKDLEDCYEALSNEGVVDLSVSELGYAKCLMKLMNEFLTDFKEEVNEYKN